MKMLLKCNFLRAWQGKKKDGSDYNAIRVIDDNDTPYVFFPNDLDVYLTLERFEPLELSIYSYKDKNGNVKVGLDKDV